MPDILTEDHCTLCTQIIQEGQRLKELAQKCVNCGLPAQEYLDRINHIIDTATKIKSQFFPQST